MPVLTLLARDVEIATKPTPRSRRAAPQIITKRSPAYAPAMTIDPKCEKSP